MKEYKWYFSIWRLRQYFLFGIEWTADKSWFRVLQDFNVYLGFFAFGWIKMPAPVKTTKEKK